MSWVSASDASWNTFWANSVWSQNYWDDTETSDPNGHKFSDSHSSLSSFASWRSRSHSRISSVTTLSGIHSTRQSVAELPLLEMTLSSCSESYRPSSSAKRLRQSVNTRSLPSYQNDEMTAPERSKSPSDAVLNMNNSNRPVLNMNNSNRHQIVDAFPGLVLYKLFTQSNLLHFVVWL